MSVTTIFLDLYQTLAHFHPPREQRQSLVLKELGFQVDETALLRGYLAADHYYTLVGMEKPLFLRSAGERREVMARYQQVVMESAGLSHLTPRAAEIYQRYGEMDREFRLFPDVEPTLSHLRRAGYRLGLITNVTSDPAEDLEKAGLKGRFDVVVASCNLGFEKPDPRIFQAAMEELGVAPHQAVHVGDQFLADIEGATAAGIKAILLDRYDLQEGRHPHRIRKLTELPLLLGNGIL